MDVPDGKLGRRLLGEMEARGGLPRPDWAAVQARWGRLPEAERGAAWSAVERAWQGELAAAWREQGKGFAVYEEGELLVTTDLPEREARRVLAWGRRAFAVIERCLGGLGVEAYLHKPAGYNGAGLDVAVVCRGVAEYLDYTADGDDADHAGAVSGGMCLRQGAVHVAAHGATAAELEATLAHEWAHSRLAEWDLPVWLEEGLVTHLQEAVVPSGRFAPDLQTVALHREYWTPGRLGRFFDGRGFCGIEDGYGLPYDLSHTVFGNLMRGGGPELLEFLAAASWRDAGVGACEAVYGCSLAELLPDFVVEAAAGNAAKYGEPEHEDDPGQADPEDPGDEDDDDLG